MGSKPTTPMNDEKIGQRGYQPQATTPLTAQQLKPPKTDTAVQTPKPPVVKN